MELLTTMLPLLKISIFILQPSNIKVYYKIPCQSHKCTHIYTIFQLSKTYTDSFYIQDLTKTDGTLNNHVNIAINSKYISKI